MSKAVEIFLDGLRKQSFSVILSLGGLFCLGWWSFREKTSCETAIASLQISMDSCAASRERLAIKVARLEEKIQALEARPAVRKR